MIRAILPSPAGAGSISAIRAGGTSICRLDTGFTPRRPSVAGVLTFSATLLAAWHGAALTNAHRMDARPPAPIAAAFAEKTNQWPAVSTCPAWHRWTADSRALIRNQTRLRPPDPHSTR